MYGTSPEFRNKKGINLNICILIKYNEIKRKSDQGVSLLFKLYFKKIQNSLSIYDSPNKNRRFVQKSS